jgi:thioredoxin-like negative regulator of GroEL
MTPALALSLLLAGAAREAPAPAAPPVAIKWEKNFEEALKKARRAGKPIIVDFWADWCGWCHRLDRTTYADPWVARKAQDFVAAKVDTEGSRKERAFATKYQVTSLPTIVFLSPTGRQLGRVNGFQGPGQFPRTLEAALQIAHRVMGWEEAIERNPEDARALFALGAHVYEQEYFEDARELLRQAVVHDAGEEPENRRQARMLLAIIEHVTRNFAEAERLVKEALALEPNDEDQPKLLFFLGRTYMSSGRQAEGAATFEVIVRQYPQSPIAQKARETLVNMGRRAAPLP